MIFQHKLGEVLSGQKTQTRRLMHWDTYYKVGGVYAVQPGRGEKAVAHIRVTKTRKEDVRNISDIDVIAEGFDSRDEFLKLWQSMHGDSYNAEVLEFELIPKQLELMPCVEMSIEKS